MRIGNGVTPPPSSTAALSWLPATRRFDATFVGINGDVKVDATVVAQFPESITQKQLQSKVQDLEPRKISIAFGHAQFTRITPSDTPATDGHSASHL
jgi:hypothetical protein